MIKMNEDITDLHSGDQLRILPETTELRLGCCKCNAIHFIKIIHEGENVLLRFVTEKELSKVKDVV